MDWKDMLSGLKADLPEGEETVVSEPAAPAPKKERLRVEKSVKGRGGKTATIISGFAGSDAELKPVLRSLQSALGVGGSARGGEILIQGDLRDKIVQILRKMGYDAR